MSAGWRRRLASVAILAALTLVARLPFLLRGDRFFDSDEAVEGLMARHVLQGEFPLVLWGQGYKGVPEVYLTAAVFAGFGSSVVALKATTLGLFIVLVSLQFVLVRRLFGDRVAWIASLLLIAGPPSLVLWSLSGNAEIVLTMIAGALLLLSWNRWNATSSLAGLAGAAAAVGFGLWVHQYIVYYLVALALTDWWAGGAKPAALAPFFSTRGVPGWLKWWLRACLFGAALYIVLGFIAFFGGGFTLYLVDVAISVHHPQKMWQLAAAFLLLGGGVRWAASTTLSTRTILVAAAAFGAGYSPALIEQLREGGGAPLGEMTLRDLVSAVPGIITAVFPIVTGVRTPATEWLPGAVAMGTVIVAALVVAYMWIGTVSTPFFHVFVVSTLVVFLASGSYLDAQSYRYLMPVHAALPVLYAIAADAAWRRSRALGVGAAAALLAVFGWQQAGWYRRLPPDTSTATMIRCAEKHSITHGRAGYWTAYKMTFLTDETVIVAPTDGVDRYPLYTAAVDRHSPVAVFLPAASTEATGCDSVMRLVN